MHRLKQPHPLIRHRHQSPPLPASSHTPPSFALLLDSGALRPASREAALEDDHGKKPEAAYVWMEIAWPYGQADDTVAKVAAAGLKRRMGWTVLRVSARCEREN